MSNNRVVISTGVLLIFFWSMPVRSQSTELPSIKCGDYIVDVAKIEVGERSETLIKIYDPHHKKIFPNIRSAGDFLSLCKKGRFVLLDTSIQHSPEKSYLMSPQPSIISIYEFGEISRYGVSDDQEIFWVQAFQNKSGMNFNRVIVFDYDGKKLHDAEYSEARTIRISTEGVIYKITVVEPDYPG